VDFPHHEKDRGIMTRTWLQRIMQRTDTDVLSYDFGESCPTIHSWWFRGWVVVACICGLWFFLTVTA
jgi:hypothetical protein